MISIKIRIDHCKEASKLKIQILRLWGNFKNHQIQWLMC